MGYFECWRLWFILDELKARDLEHEQLAMDATNSSVEYRKEFNDWLISRQPRRHNKVGEIPAEVLAKFAEAFNSGR